MARSSRWLRRRALAATALPVLLLASGGITAWSQPRGTHAVARPGPEATVIWKVPTPAWGHVAADGSRAYFLSHKHEVTAVDARTGAVVWRTLTGDADPMEGAGVVVAGETIVAGDYNLTGHDRSTGALKWRFVPTVGYAPGPHLGQARGDLVYSGSAAGLVYAVDVASGRARWTAKAGDGPGPTTKTLVHDPVVDRDVVFAGYVNFAGPTTGGMVALDAATGAERWRATLSARHPLIGVGAAGHPLVAGDLVILSSRDGVIQAHRRADGSLAWAIPALDLSPFPGSPRPEVPGPRADFRAIGTDGRRLFAGSNTGYVIAYDLETRQEVWRYKGMKNGSIGFELATDASNVYIPTWSGRLATVDAATGRERWWIGDFDLGFRWPPALVGDVAYASSRAGFYALRR